MPALMSIAHSAKSSSCLYVARSCASPVCQCSIVIRSVSTQSPPLHPVPPRPIGTARSSNARRPNRPQRACCGQPWPNAPLALFGIVGGPIGKHTCINVKGNRPNMTQAIRLKESTLQKSFKEGGRSIDRDIQHFSLNNDFRAQQGYGPKIM